MRTVELLPDAALDAAVRAVWDRLAAAGLPSLAAHPHPTNRPHLTLAAADELPPGPPVGPLPVPVELDGAHLFDGPRGTVVWRVTPTPALAAVQRRVWSALPAAGRRPWYAPDRWFPHVSLALRTAPGQREAVLALLGRPRAAGSFTHARSYDAASRTVTSLPVSRPGG